MFEVELLENKDSLLQKLGERLPTSADVLESSDEFLVLINVPGCEKEDIDLRFANGVVRVTADRDIDYDGYEAVQQSRPERIGGTVPIPDEVDLGEARAEYRNGVLRVTLPKLDDVEVEGGDDSYEEVTIDRDEGEDEDEATDSRGDADVPDDAPASRSELEEMAYNDLQSLAGDTSVKGNLPKDEMIDQLADELDL